MKKLFNKARNIFISKEGASNIEIIVWVSVCLVIATALFLFREEIVTFVTNATNYIGTFDWK